MSPLHQDPELERIGSDLRNCTSKTAERWIIPQPCLSVGRLFCVLEVLCDQRLFITLTKKMRSVATCVLSERTVGLRSRGCFNIFSSLQIIDISPLAFLNFKNRVFHGLKAKDRDRYLKVLTKMDTANISPSGQQQILGNSLKAAQGPGKRGILPSIEQLTVARTSLYTSLFEEGLAFGLSSDIFWTTLYLRSIEPASTPTTTAFCY